MSMALNKREMQKMNDLIKKVNEWAIDKGLDAANPADQFMKIVEEIGEVGQAYTREQPENLKLELGDVLVTVIIFALQNGIDPAEALDLAYNKISDRKGKMRNGVFIKEADL